MNQNLAPYEQRLLTELRGVVAAAADPAPASSRRPRRRVAIGFGLAVALAVAGAVGAPVLLGAGDQPAYAAEREPDGSIRITIREYRDAKGLQARLRKLGVPAVVDYVPNGKQCREPRGRYVADDVVANGLISDLPPDDDGERRMLLHPEMIGPGQTFVFSTTVIRDLDSDNWAAMARVGLVAGPVTPCELVPGTRY